VGWLYFKAKASETDSMFSSFGPEMSAAAVKGEAGSTFCWTLADRSAATVLHFQVLAWIDASNEKYSTCTEGDHWSSACAPLATDPQVSLAYDRQPTGKQVLLVELKDPL